MDYRTDKALVAILRIDMHVAHPDITDPAERKQGAQELIDAIRTYLK